MTGPERGFLLLTQQLGDPGVKPLTPAQFRELSRLVRLAEKNRQQRDLREEDLLALGCDREFAGRVISLLDREETLAWYLEKARQAGCKPVTCFDSLYPVRLEQVLAGDAPSVLWTKGDPEMMKKPCVALVGSRDLKPENRRFAEAVGAMAAQKGFTLVSGNARGADRTAQESCLAAGGCVISVVADALEENVARDRVLYVSEDGFDKGFTAYRALRRNRIIHSLADRTFVAQCTLEKGGTWDGTVKNLRHGWSRVYCFRDGSPAAQVLCAMGACGATAAIWEDIPETEDQLKIKSI